jgi:hypothetical protein
MKGFVCSLCVCVCVRFAEVSVMQAYNSEVDLGDGTGSNEVPLRHQHNRYTLKSIFLLDFQNTSAHSQGTDERKGSQADLSTSTRNKGRRRRARELRGGAVRVNHTRLITNSDSLFLR